jgi:hypothetical protein
LISSIKNGDFTNYGIRIEADTAQPDPTICGFDSLRVTNDESHLKPTLRIYNLQESDGNLYKADMSDYLLCRSIQGVIPSSITSGNTGQVQFIGLLSGTFDDDGGKLYLTTSGALSTSTNNAVRTIKISEILANNKAVLDIQRTGLFIKSISLTNIPTTTAIKVYTPSDAKLAKMVYTYSGTTYRYLIYRETGGGEGAAAWGANYLSFSTDDNTNSITIRFYN